MTQCTDEAVLQMLPLVSAQRREQALSFRHTFGRFCCLKSWLMLKEMIGEVGEFEYNENGKPFLSANLFFSISHCKAGIAVIADEQPVGIDIESIREAKEDLMERTMNAEERRGMDDRKFIRLWTQKEAIVKAQGTGIMSFEQLQAILPTQEWKLQTVEKENYIYSIAYK